MKNNSRKKVIALRIIVGLIIVTTLATGIIYFAIRTTKPWMAFYIACCGGILNLNYLVCLYLVNKVIK